MKLVTLLIVFITCLVVNNVYSQYIISSAGSHFESSNLQISWTMGEPVIETILDSEYSLTQGFHQSLLQVTSFRSIPYPSVEVKVYPNPATEFVNISISDSDLTGWAYCFYSTDGRLLLEKEVDSNLTQINVGQYVTSNYVLKILKGGNETNSFKIIINK